MAAQHLHREVPYQALPRRPKHTSYARRARTMIKARRTEVVRCTADAFVLASSLKQDQHNLKSVYITLSSSDSISAWRLEVELIEVRGWENELLLFFSCASGFWFCSPSITRLNSSARRRLPSGWRSARRHRHRLYLPQEWLWI